METFKDSNLPIPTIELSKKNNKDLWIVDHGDREAVYLWNMGYPLRTCSKKFIKKKDLRFKTNIPN